MAETLQHSVGGTFNVLDQRQRGFFKSKRLTLTLTYVNLLQAGTDVSTMIQMASRIVGALLGLTCIAS